MFSLTANATTELKAARIASGIPDTWGIRFFPPVAGKAGVTFAFVDSPEANDVVGGFGPAAHLRGCRGQRAHRRRHGRLQDRRRALEPHHPTLPRWPCPQVVFMLKLVHSSPADQPATMGA